MHHLGAAVLEPLTALLRHDEPAVRLRAQQILDAIQQADFADLAFVKDPHIRAVLMQLLAEHKLRRAGLPFLFAHLTTAEHQRTPNATLVAVFGLYLAGLPRAAIAARLQCSEQLVRNYISEIYGRFGVTQTEWPERRAGHRAVARPGPGGGVFVKFWTIGCRMEWLGCGMYGRSQSPVTQASIPPRVPGVFRTKPSSPRILGEQDNCSGAPVAGSYQLEIAGYLAAAFTLHVAITPADRGGATASISGNTDAFKPVQNALDHPTDGLARRSVLTHITHTPDRICASCAFHLGMRLVPSVTAPRTPPHHQLCRQQLILHRTTGQHVQQHLHR